MHPLLLTLFIGALLLRVGSVAVSMRHEKALKAHGAREYGRSNSHLLAAAHVLFYGGALVEGLWRSTQLTRWTTVGIVLYVLSIIALLLVWRELKGLWTVKLLIVLVVGLPLYLLVLRRRIVQEEQVMHEHFPHYATPRFPPRDQDTNMGHPSS